MTAEAAEPINAPVRGDGPVRLGLSSAKIKTARFGTGSPKTVPTEEGRREGDDHE